MTTLDFYYSEKLSQQIKESRKRGDTLTWMLYSGQHGRGDRQVPVNPFDNYFKGKLYNSATPVGVSPGNWDDFVYLGRGDSIKDVEYRPV